MPYLHVLTQASAPPGPTVRRGMTRLLTWHLKRHLFCMVCGGLVGCQLLRLRLSCQVSFCTWLCWDTFAVSTCVVHRKKKVKVKGVWKWQLPKYVRLVSHSIPGSKKKMTVKAGTQVIDRAWRFLKERIVLNQRCKVGTARLRAKVRSAQYEYWHRNEDLWLCTGELCTWQMKKFFLPTK